MVNCNGPCRQTYKIPLKEEYISIWQYGYINRCMII